MTLRQHTHTQYTIYMYVPGEQIYQLGFDEEYFVEGQRFV